MCMEPEPLWGQRLDLNGFDYIRLSMYSNFPAGCAKTIQN